MWYPAFDTEGASTISVFFVVQTHFWLTFPIRFGIRDHQHKYHKLFFVNLRVSTEQSVPTRKRKQSDRIHAWYTFIPIFIVDR